MDEKRKFLHSLVFPSFFLLLIWMIKIIETSLDLNLSNYGLYPLKIKGLPGIITSPLIHSDFKHLFDNSLPLFFLSIAIFYFYRPVAYKTFFYIYLLTGLWVWIGGRSAFHIGASGLVYGFASFLFISGIIRNNINLLAISLIVVFLYGGLVWGLFPFDYKISWESHLFGVIAGMIMAFYFRRHGPSPPKYDWEEEEENDDEDNDDNQSKIGINIYDLTALNDK